MERKPFIIFDKESGKILRSGFSYSEADYQIISDNEDAIGGFANSSKYYVDVDSREVREKTEFIVNYKNGILTLPPYSELYIDGVYYGVVDGAVEINKEDESDRYTVIVNSVKFLEKEWEL